ncbi:MAG: alpha/beta hydrolase [Agathobacter sp.]|nr:alpha/beta hydrolase [Agathobacter sp.]
MKKSTKCILFTLGISIAGIYAYNKFVEETASQKNLLSDKDGQYYNWKYGNVFYTKSGSGSPVLLIHDTDASASSAEWNKMIHRLTKNHTVYSIDLLGCGLSDKPALEYTNYLYVQMLQSFMKDVIQEKTTVIASNISASFVIMTNHMDDSLFEKIILINPASLKQLDMIPDELSKVKKTIIQLPFVGTFVYNVMNNMQHIDESFRTRYVTRPQLISSSIEDVYYEAAHKNGSNGRYLYSSLLGNYVNNSITHAVKAISTPTLIIGSVEMKRYALALDDYHKVNKNIDIVRITNGSLYPHMEIPEKITSLIEDFI